MRLKEKCCVVAPKTTLKRTLSLWQASICGIGIILGAGIYALVGVAAAYSGPALWLGFLIAGILAIFTGLSYAELSSIFKKNNAEFDYVDKAFNKPLAILIASSMVFAGLFVAAAVATAFGNYLGEMTGIPVLISAAGIILLLTLVNLWGLKQSVFLNTVFTLIEATGLLMIIFFGIKYWGSVDLLAMPQGFSGVLRSGALVFFSFLGFEAIVKLTEETKSPTKNIPRAIIISVSVCTLMYVLVAVSAVSILGWEALSTSNAPLADVARAALGNFTFVVLGVIALCSTTNTVLMEVVATSRQIYGMAKKKVYPEVLSHVSRTTHTPHNAILFVFVLAIIFLFVGNLERIASIANFFTFVTFALVNFSVIVLRKKYTKRRPFKVPGAIAGIPIIPLIGGISSLGMLYFVFLGIV